MSTNRIKTVLTVSVWVLITLVLAVAFTLHRVDVAARLEALIHHSLQGSPYKLELVGLEYLCPNQVTLKGAQLELVNPHIELLQVSDLELGVRLPALLQGAIESSFEFSCYGGQVQGQLLLPNQSLKGAVSHISLSQIDLSQYPLFRQQLNINIKGLLDAKGDLEDLSQLANPHKASIDGTFKLTQGSISELRVSDILLPTININQISGQLKSRDGVLTIEQIKLDTAEFVGEIRGSITIAYPDLEQSEIDLKLLLMPSEKIAADYATYLAMAAAFKTPAGYFPVKIRGTIAKPEIMLDFGEQ